jgi:hypothetical protein
MKRGEAGNLKIAGRRHAAQKFFTISYPLSLPLE